MTQQRASLHTPTSQPGQFECEIARCCYYYVLCYVTRGWPFLRQSLPSLRRGQSRYFHALRSSMWLVSRCRLYAYGERDGHRVNVTRQLGLVWAVALLLLIGLSSLVIPLTFDRLLSHASPTSRAAAGTGVSAADMDVTDSKVSIVITGYESGLRPIWLQSTIERYLSAAFDTLVDRVILVWNNPNVSCPIHIQHPKLVTLEQPTNSLNNRWIHTLPHIRTTAVFNLDDDVFVSEPGLQCMLLWWRDDRERMVSPYVRLVHSNNSYVMDDLRLGGRYSVALPRAIMLSRHHLETYAASDPQMLRYVDEQEARCDDILLNAAVGDSTGKAPLRILLPAESVMDHFANCDFGGMAGVGGLTMQANRAALRSECTLGIAERFFGRDSGLHLSSDAVATCTTDGRRAALRHSIQEGEFAGMLDSALCDAPKRGTQYESSSTN